MHNVFAFSDIKNDDRCASGIGNGLDAGGLFAADNADAAVDQAGPTGTIPVIKFTKKINDKKNYKLYSAKKGKKSFKQYFKISKTTGKVTVYDA